MLTAEYGGNGGIPIEPGMVVEEPDIEIGQGVSSKAISRRMQTDMSGQSGPKSSHARDDDEPRRGGRRGSRDDGRENRRRDGGNKKERNSHINGPPSMPPVPAFGLPGFPFNLPTLPNGMPMLPPGFPFTTVPAAPTNTQTPTQPPPPGRT
jgi:protein NRD1